MPQWLTTKLSPLHKTNPLCLHCLTTIGHTCVSCKWTASTKWIIKLYWTNPCREVLYSLASICVEARVQDQLRAAPRERIQWLAREDLNKAASCWQRGVHIVHFPVSEQFRYLWSAFSPSKPPSVKRLLDESLSVNYLPLHHVSPSTGVLSVDMSGNFVYKFSVLETAHRRYIALKAGCVVWVGLRLCDVLNGSTTAFREEKQPLCVRAQKRVQHFYGFTRYTAESRIDFLFIWSLLKSTKCPSKQQQKKSIRV